MFKPQGTSCSKRILEVESIVKLKVVYFLNKLFIYKSSLKWTHMTSECQMRGNEDGE